VFTRKRNQLSSGLLDFLLMLQIQKKIQFLFKFSIEGSTKIDLWFSLIEIAKIDLKCYIYSNFLKLGELNNFSSLFDRSVRKSRMLLLANLLCYWVFNWLQLYIISEYCVMRVLYSPLPSEPEEVFLGWFNSLSQKSKPFNQRIIYLAWEKK